MKIKTLNNVILNTDEQPIPNSSGKSLALRDVIANSILAPMEGDDEKKKFDRWEIYKKLRSAGGEVSLTAEEISIIKKAIGKLQPPLILGQCFDLLEGAEAEMTIERSDHKKK
jgi:hypothetical protein